MLAIETPLIVILLGPPGAGKGTHAAPLSQHLGVPHISTGDLFREHLRNKTPLGNVARSFIDAGQLVPDHLVLEMLADRVRQSDCARGYILDGFPRTVDQAEALDKQIAEQSTVIAINFDIPDRYLVERIVSRQACKQCGQLYNTQFAPPAQSGICDHCAGSLYQRDDDKEEIILKRLEVYHTQTKPVIEYYSQKQGMLHQINARGTKTQVFQDVLKACEKTQVMA